MKKINAAITGVAAYVPEDKLTNEDLTKMVDTTDEWIYSRVGIKERRILKGENLGSSYMGSKALDLLLEKTGTTTDEVEVIICATSNPDYRFPTTAAVIAI
jgi:3-oxoacyl-[acyl-carrier-protein] synthase-3